VINLELQEKGRLQKYVEQLESRPKITLLLFGIIMIVILLFTKMQQNSAFSKIIQAQEIVIKDDKSKSYIKLTIHNGIPKIVLCKGKQRIVIGIKDEWSIIGLSDGDENLRSLLGVNYKGDATLIFCNDKEDKDRFVIYVESKGIAVVKVFDMIGKLRAEFGVLPDGKPNFSFFDQKGKTVYKLLPSK
jgi:hypothetical protein